MNSTPGRDRVVSSEGPERLVYLVKENPSFDRLLGHVFNELPGFFPQSLIPEDLAGAVAGRRPSMIAIVENAALYSQLRSSTQNRDIPILYVTTGPAEKTLPIVEPDLSWIMKNDSAELLAVLNKLLAAPGGKRILCVDDSQVVLKKIKKAFAGTPYAVFTAGNGREALDLLDRFIPDLILTDIEMPVMDGLAFCKLVRSRPETLEAPLIILSSRVDHQTITDGFEAGADEYLTKPFFPDELLNKVEPYLVPPPTRRKEQVLVASESFIVTHQLRMALDSQGFDVKVASGPDDTLAAALEDPPDLIVSDGEMAGITGFQLCDRVRAESSLKRVPFVLMTGKTSTGARKMGRKVGVTAYLTKPFTREGVIMLVERLLAENRSLRALEWDLVLASITSLAKALDERDPYTRFHSENVARFAVAIGRKAGWNAAELENLRLAGLLHDIGKIGIPDKVLHKPGSLSPEETEKIKEHSRVGADILGPIPSLERVVPGILHHHERLDGEGYPHGFKGDEIPPLAQILAVADTFDALVTDRPYRKGLPRTEAMKIMKEVSGTQLSPTFVNLFIEWLDESE